MIIQPFLPSGSVVFCDDVRQEVNGKRTFIGVYANLMYVSSFPATLPTFCAAVTYRDAPESQGKVTVRVFYEGGGEDRLLGEIEFERAGELDLPKTEDFTMAETHLVFAITPFHAPAVGRVKVRAYKDDDEIRMGSIQIKLHPSDEGSE